MSDIKPRHQWISVRYLPGLAEDLTSWETSIDENGYLSQIVRVSRFAPPLERTDHLCKQLSPEQVSQLRSLVAATDFAAFKGAISTIDDAEDCSISVREGEAVSEFQAPLLTWSCFQRYLDEQSLFDPPWASRPCLQIPVTQDALSSALRLWHVLDTLSPHGLHSKVA